MAEHFGVAETDIDEEKYGGLYSAIRQIAQSDEGAAAAIAAAEAMSPATEKVDAAQLAIRFFSQMGANAAQPGSTALSAAASALPSAADYLAQVNKRNKELERARGPLAVQLATAMKPKTAKTPVKVMKDGVPIFVSPDNALGLEAWVAKSKESGTLNSSTVQKVEILDNGLSMTVMKNGDVIVKDGANNVITGDAALNAIKEAQDFGVDLTGSKAGSRRAKTVAATVANDAFGKINIMRSNIINLEEARRLVTDGGANTGFIMDKLPNLFAGSIALNQIQNVLGLNIIGSVTFGALSEGELKLALNTALPTNFNEPDLIDWIDRKIIAEQKLSEYIQEQAIFLADGDKTIGDWLRFQQKEEKESTELPEVKLDFSTMTTEEILKINPDELSESDQESLDKRMNELGM